MENLGYESHNSIIVLGTLGLVAFYWITRVVFYLFIAVPFVLISKRGLSWTKKMKKKLFFGDLITVTTEGYFEFLISAYLNSMFPIYTTNGEILAVGIGWFSAFITLIFYPIVCFIIAITPLKKFQQKKFIEKWGPFFS